MYVVFFCIFSVLNFYVCHNAKFLITIRSQSFYYDDIYYAFFSLWTDVLFNYWVCLVKNTMVFKNVIKSKERFEKTSQLKEKSVLRAKSKLDIEQGKKVLTELVRNE